MDKKVLSITETQTRIGSLCRFDSKELDKIGQVNYLTAVGNPINRSFVTKQGSTVGSASLSRYTSATAHVKLIPTIGRTISDADGASTDTKYTPVVANQMAAYIYQLLYNKNMNTANFSAADILKIFLAIDSIIVKVNEIKLDLQVASKSWNVYDLGMPATLVRSYINYTDIFNNRAIYIDKLDTLINRLAVIEIPMELKYIMWHATLTNKVLVDDPLHKTTYYRFEYGAYWKYNHSTGTVALVNRPITTITLAQDILELNSMIDELVADEDILNLLANIRLIFGGSSISIAQFEDKCPEFTYDYVLLMALKNANFGPSAASMVANYTISEIQSGLKTSSLQVNLVTAPIGTAGGGPNEGTVGVSFEDWIISYDANDPKCDELVLATHWVNTFRSRPGDTDNGTNEYLWYHGSEIICEIGVVVVLGAAGTANMQTFEYSVDGLDVMSIGSANNPVMPWQGVMMHNIFNFLPRTYFIFADVSSYTPGNVVGVIWQDTENMFKVSVPYLAGVHEYTLRNQIGVAALPETK